MALNASLVAMSARGWSREHCETVWGRSYIDHLRMLAGALAHEPFDAEQKQRCRALLDIPVMQPTGLVKLARTRDEAASRALEVAAEIVHVTAQIVDTPTSC